MPAPQPALRLRPATADDVAPLAALYVACVEQLGPLVYSADQVRAWAAFGADEEGFTRYVLDTETRLAEGDDGQLLGFSGFSLHEGVAEVRSLYVTPAATRRGLGADLLADCLRRAMAAGATRLEAWATPFSRPLFARAGMLQVQAQWSDFNGVEFERYRMVGDLASLAAADLRR